MANGGSVIETKDRSNEVLLKTIDETNERQKLVFLKGKLVDQKSNKILGLNGDNVEAFDLSITSHKWEAEEVDTDSTETDFTRVTLDKKPPSGSWPFNCEKLNLTRNICVNPHICVTFLMTKTTHISGLHCTNCWQTSRISLNLEFFYVRNSYDYFLICLTFTPVLPNVQVPIVCG